MAAGAEKQPADEVGLGPITGHLAVAAVPVTASRQMVVVAARSANGMRLISLAVNAQGKLNRKWETQLSEAKAISVNPVSRGRFLTTLQDGKDRMRIIGWWLGPKGKIIRLGEEQAGKADVIASTVLRRNNGKTRLVLTAMQSGNGNLKLITYDSNL